MRDKNIGQTGKESLRVNGLKVDDLPLGQGNEAKEGLVEFLKTDKENKANAIKARYPKVSVAYCKAAIKECKNNVETVKNMKEELKEKISEYSVLIRQSSIRDAQIESLNKDNPEDADKIKELLRQYPPYNVKALEEQITQFEQSIERCNSVIEQDYESIAEFSKNLSLVEQRDRELLSIK